MDSEVPLKLAKLKRRVTDSNLTTDRTQIPRGSGVGAIHFDTNACRGLRHRLISTVHILHRFLVLGVGCSDSRWRVYRVLVRMFGGILGHYGEHR